MIILHFRKADVAIGVKSYKRLYPKLDCQYLINFNQLPKFLMNLLKNDFNFSEKLLKKIYIIIIDLFLSDNVYMNSYQTKPLSHIIFKSANNGSSFHCSSIIS